MANSVNRSINPYLLISVQSSWVQFKAPKISGLHVDD